MPSINGKSDLVGVKVMLIGDSGTGKTYSLRTILPHGIKVFILATENGYETLGDLPSSDVKWVHVKTTYGNLTQLKESAENVASLSNEMLLKKVDMTRMKNSPYMPILKHMMDFVDSRTGESFGNVGDWNTDRMFVIDSFSGLCDAIIANTIGTKPVMSQGEYQIAQIAAKALVQQMCTDLQCHFALLCHAEKELDPVNGGYKIMAQGIGAKLSPQLPRSFSDVILTKRTMSKFSWDTADGQAALKSRNLGIAAELPPSFFPLIEKWKKQGGTIEASVRPEPFKAPA